MDNDFNIKIAEYLKRTKSSLDPRKWVQQIHYKKDSLAKALAGTDEKDIIEASSKLFFTSVVFTVVSSAAEQLDLYSLKERSEIMELITEASELTAEAMDRLAEFDGWTEAVEDVLSSTRRVE
ncbi:MAG: hypothetical protein COA78_20395 [Blastopirellula sp.]|nr:MAG: hypothetical protein COA78_20395 [Blastopirellula sp.]